MVDNRDGQATKLRPGRRLVSLGKLNVPKPLNLPSQKSENAGNDPNVHLVPEKGNVWGGQQRNASNSLDRKEQQQPAWSAINSVPRGVNPLNYARNEYEPSTAPPYLDKQVDRSHLLQHPSQHNPPNAGVWNNPIEQKDPSEASQRYTRHDGSGNAWQPPLPKGPPPSRVQREVVDLAGSALVHASTVQAKHLEGDAPPYRMHRSWADYTDDESLGAIPNFGEGFNGQPIVVTQKEKGGSTGRLSKTGQAIGNTKKITLLQRDHTPDAEVVSKSSCDDSESIKETQESSKNFQTKGRGSSVMSRANGEKSVDSSRDSGSISKERLPEKQASNVHLLQRKSVDTKQFSPKGVVSNGDGMDPAREVAPENRSTLSKKPEGKEKPCPQDTLGPNESEEASATGSEKKGVRDGLRSAGAVQSSCISNNADQNPDQEPARVENSTLDSKTVQVSNQESARGSGSARSNRKKRKPAHKTGARSSVDSGKSETSPPTSAAPMPRERNTKGPKTRNARSFVSKLDKSGDGRLQSRESEASVSTKMRNGKEPRTMNEPRYAPPDADGSKVAESDQTSSSSVAPPEGLHKSLKHMKNTAQWQKKVPTESKQNPEKVKLTNKEPRSSTRIGAKALSAALEGNNKTRRISRPPGLMNSLPKNLQENEKASTASARVHAEPTTPSKDVKEIHEKVDEDPGRRHSGRARAKWRVKSNAHVHNKVVREKE